MTTYSNTNFYYSRNPITGPNAATSHTHSTLCLAALLDPVGFSVDTEPAGTVVVPVATIVSVCDPITTEAGRPDVGVMIEVELAVVAVIVVLVLVVAAVVFAEAVTLAVAVVVAARVLLLV